MANFANTRLAGGGFRASLRGVKRLFLWLVVALSGLYLLLMGPLFDPVPLVDEAVAIGVLAFALRALGYDVGRWIPLVRRFRRSAGGAPGAPPPAGGRSRPRNAEKDAIIDV